MQKEGGTWLFHRSIFGVVPSTLMRCCLVRCAAGQATPVLHFLFSQKENAAQWCVSHYVSSCWVWGTLDVKRFFFFFYPCHIDQGKLPGSLEHQCTVCHFFDELADTRQFGKVVVVVGGGGGCFTLCLSLICSAFRVFVLWQEKGGNHTEAKTFHIH